METEIDFGIVYIKQTGSMPRVKVKLSEWYGKWYLHIREWNMDGDTGKLFPTSKGIALDPNELDSIIKVLEQVSTHLSKKFKNHHQLEFDFSKERTEPSV
jgi:hypothetical protein